MRLTEVASEVGGAVLCGGASRRMGRDKALIVVDGRPLAERVSSVLEAGGCSPVVLVGGDGERLVAATQRPWIADSWPGEGPLGGVVDALRWFHDTCVAGIVVSACDLPDLTAAAVRSIVAAGGAAVAHAGRTHPSLAYWPVSAADQLGHLFENGVRSLHEAAAAVDAAAVEVDAAALRNANHPGDLAD